MSKKIYTKTGDKGTTALYGKGRVSKSHIRIEAYGTVDELNSNLGVLIAKIDKKHHQYRVLIDIQNQLFTIGANLATVPTKKIKPLPFDEKPILLMEQQIDKMEEDLPPLKSFILPGGSEKIAFCHICRTICRRAERRVVSAGDSELELDPIIIQYLNRLSDYLFVLGRYLGMEDKVEEIQWKV